jgi:predicted lipid-binding transport protein (Tim44 family)
LGKKTGNESDIAHKFSQKPSKFTESNPDKEIEKSKQQFSESKKIMLHENSAINEKLNNIVKLDSNFTVENFVDGAKKAFEYIIEKYSDENIKPLEKLLSTDIFKMFSKQINNRAKKKENLDVSIIGIKEAKIEDVSLNSNIASIKVKFSSEQVHVIKNDKGKIISGDGNQILSIVESWFFSKNLKRNDPNWVLEKIEESN